MSRRPSNLSSAETHNVEHRRPLLDLLDELLASRLGGEVRVGNVLAGTRSSGGEALRNLLELLLLARGNVDLGAVLYETCGRLSG